MVGVMFPQSDPPLKYCSIDPGETSGWALWNEAGICVYFGQVPDGSIGIAKLLNMLPDTVDVFIVEDYLVNPNIKQGGSRGPAQKCIGHIEAYCDQREIAPPVLQMSNKKRIGYIKLKERPPSNHAKSHAPDARAHGEFYMWSQKIRQKYAAKGQ